MAQPLTFSYFILLYVYFYFWYVILLTFMSNDLNDEKFCDYLYTFKGFRYT